MGRGSESIKCIPTPVLIRKLEMIFLHTANALNTFDQCNALPCSGMPRQAWVMSILNALLTEKAVLYACVELVAFQQKYLIIVCKESPWFPRPEPCIYNLYRFEQLPLSPQNEKGRGRGELVTDWETESLKCLLYNMFLRVLFFCTAQQCEKRSLSILHWSTLTQA